MFRWLRRILIAALLLLMLGVGGAWLLLRASLPQLDGELSVAGLAAPVSIGRDALGTVMIEAANREDVSYALGYVHGQERFFEMDLLRRRAAGELSELFGSVALATDRGARLHRFGSRVAGFVEALPKAQRQHMQRYAQGVNAGLAALSARPFPYLLLQSEPRPWTEQDGLLAPLAMFFNLQDASNSRELKLERMRAALPVSVFAFLTAAGTEWDAPLFGDALGDPAFPDEADWDLRQTDLGKPLDSTPTSEGIGSNNFAVAGTLTAHGGAILANDMHLGLRVPNIWFRAQLRYPDGLGGTRIITGVSLPGTPVIAAGSNGKIAWGFTNSYGDWLDFVELQIDPNDPARYLTGAGWQMRSATTETILVRGAPSESLQVLETVFGPIAAQSSLGKPLALAWTAHHSQAVNATLSELETADTLDAALAVAHRTGMPAQNLLLASADGRIAWTLIGAIPKRGGGDPQFPMDWSTAGRAWSGWYADEQIPRLVDPPSGRLWTANARVVTGDDALRIGDGGYTIGARSRQIRDALQARERLSETDLLAIQLDDRALFLQRWFDLLKRVLAGSSAPRLQALNAALADWQGRAHVDSRAYRLVRDFRLRVHRRFLQLFEAPLRAQDADWTWPTLPQIEGAVWKTIEEAPAHLLPRNFANWDAWLLAAAADTLDQLDSQQLSPADASWGALNTTVINHPLSAALPKWAASWLNMPAQALDGDQYMPRVQGPRFGASERMVVAPGHEEQGIFHMPGGQSGHPLSPFYGAGHADWAAGAPSPFLPGPAQHRLLLQPAATP